MENKIVRLRPKPKPEEPEEKFFVHQCVNVEFALRMDGIVVCPKCGEEIGWYTLYGQDD